MATKIYDDLDSKVNRKRLKEKAEGLVLGRLLSNNCVPRFDGYA